MARKERVDSGAVIILNETVVGVGGTSRRSDIQLVQFFLRQFFLKQPELFRKLPKSRKNASALVTIDGKFGPQTAAGIVEFQKAVRARGNPIHVDGIVNVAHSVNSSITNTQYTILFLNLFFSKFIATPEAVLDVENHPDVMAFAPELRSELSRAGIGDEFEG